MCYFITIGIHKLETDLLNKHISGDLHASRCENKNLMKFLNKDYQGYIITNGMCSCDLYSSTSKESIEEFNEKQRKKYKKKGWSESKISRALKDSGRTFDQGSIGLRDDVKHVIGSIAQNSNGIYLYVRMYKGDQTTEDIKVTVGLDIGSKDLISGKHVLEEETLIKVNR